MGQRARFPVDFVFLSTSVHVERQLQRQHLLSTKGHEGPRRTATATPLVHEGPRRTAKNCNCNTFCPRRATKDREELQLQHLLSTKGHEGPRRTATATPFVHEGPRRTAKNCNCNTFCPRRATKGREELQRHLLFSTKGREELQLQHLLSTKGREGPRRTAVVSGQWLVEGGGLSAGSHGASFWYGRDLIMAWLWPDSCNLPGPMGRAILRPSTDHFFELRQSIRCLAYRLPLAPIRSIGCTCRVRQRFASVMLRWHRP